MIAPVSAELKKQAQALFETAKQEKDPMRRDQLLNEAKEAWPTLPGLRDYEIAESNLHVTLRVGVRRAAGADVAGPGRDGLRSAAVELVFESLVKLDPDGAAAAAGNRVWQGRPILIPRGRQFDLSPEVRWSTGKVVTVYDARETLKQMRAGRVPTRPPVWAGLLDPLESIEAASNAHRVPLTLSQGWLDPLALMNFKMLPQGTDAASAEFAANPLGSGPYVYAKLTRTDEGGRPCVAFTANPYYGARPSKDKLPRIEKIHFIAYNFKDDDPKSDHKDELADLLADRPGRLDLLLDLTAREAAALQEKAPAYKIKKVTGRRRRTGGFTSWPSTTRSSTWTTPPSAAPWPRDQPRQAAGRRFPGVAGAGFAFAAERPLSDRVMGGRPQAGPEARRQDHVRSV